MLICLNGCIEETVMILVFALCFSLVPSLVCVSPVLLGAYLVSRLLQCIIIFFFNNPLLCFFVFFPLHQESPCSPALLAIHAGPAPSCLPASPPLPPLCEQPLLLNRAVNQPSADPLASSSSKSLNKIPFLAQSAFESCICSQSISNSFWQNVLTIVDPADPDSVQQAVSSQGLLDHYKPAAETSARAPCLPLQPGS